ncbi:MAG: hypothetical protein Ct9H90mP18_04350 [Gammaproteobacteria bacterium]|nr:MAG: hypothetical protein Ct9H90mP18_04350 [Gammaproteobacteria bacterium]
MVLKILRDFSYSALPDRIETGTFLVAAAITGGRIIVKQAISSHLEAVLKKITTIRPPKIHFTESEIHLDMKGKRPKAIDIDTGPYPQFPTDMQAQLTALNAIADGTSIIRENIFENRFMHVQEMTRMGADIKLDQKTRYCSW